MSAQDILTVSTVVVALVQYAKWSGVPDERGPGVVLGLSLLGVAFWAYSVGNFSRATAFDYLAGYVTVATSAAGIFGFTRKARTSITSTKEPPEGGAGSSATDGAPDDEASSARPGAGPGMLRAVLAWLTSADRCPICRQRLGGSYCRPCAAMYARRV